MFGTTWVCGITFSDVNFRKFKHGLFLHETLASHFKCDRYQISKTIPPKGKISLNDVSINYIFKAILEISD